MQPHVVMPADQLARAEERARRVRPRPSDEVPTEDLDLDEFTLEEEPRQHCHAEPLIGFLLVQILAVVGFGALAVVLLGAVVLSVLGG